MGIIISRTKQRPGGAPIADTFSPLRDRRLTLEHMRTFLAVVDGGGFVHAGRTLHRTQSAVTQNVRKLEEIVGCTLLERRQGHITGLTAEGERFLPQVRDILGRLSNAVGALRSAPMTGRIRLGVPDDFNASDIQTAVSCCRAMNPDLKVEVRSALSGGIRAMARDGDLDVALFRATDGDDGISDMSLRSLGSESLHWVQRPDLQIGDWAEVPLVLFPDGCPYRDAALRALTAAGRPFHVAYSSPSIANIRNAVAAGLGVGVLNRRLCDASCAVLDEQAGFPLLPDARLVLAVRTEQAINRDFANYLVRSGLG